MIFGYLDFIDGMTPEQIARGVKSQNIASCAAHPENPRCTELGVLPTPLAPATATRTIPAAALAPISPSATVFGAVKDIRISDVSVTTPTGDLISVNKNTGSTTIYFDRDSAGLRNTALTVDSKTGLAVFDKIVDGQPVPVAELAGWSRSQQILTAGKILLKTQNQPVNTDLMEQLRLIAVNTANRLIPATAKAL